MNPQRSSLTGVRRLARPLDLAVERVERTLGWDVIELALNYERWRQIRTYRVKSFHGKAETSRNVHCEVQCTGFRAAASRNARTCFSGKFAEYDRECGSSSF
jgi:hypothetical protein